MRAEMGDGTYTQRLWYACSCFASILAMGATYFALTSSLTWACVLAIGAIVFCFVLSRDPVNRYIRMARSIFCLLTAVLLIPVFKACLEAKPLSFSIYVESAPWQVVVSLVVALIVAMGFDFLFRVPRPKLNLILRILLLQQRPQLGFFLIVIVCATAFGATSEIMRAARFGPSQKVRPEEGAHLPAPIVFDSTRPFDLEDLRRGGEGRWVQSDGLTTSGANRNNPSYLVLPVAELPAHFELHIEIYGRGEGDPDLGIVLGGMVDKDGRCSGPQLTYAGTMVYWHNLSSNENDPAQNAYKHTLAPGDAISGARSFRIVVSNEVFRVFSDDKELSKFYSGYRVERGGQIILRTVNDHFAITKIKLQPC